jgi:hypothetical protein
VGYFDWKKPVFFGENGFLIAKMTHYHRMPNAGPDRGEILGKTAKKKGRPEVPGTA